MAWIKKDNKQKVKVKEPEEKELEEKIEIKKPEEIEEQAEEEVEDEEEQEELTEEFVKNILVSFERRLQNLEAALFRLKGSI